MDDKQLVTQILKGNEKALRYFYDKYQPRLLTFITNKIANEKDAEEILQDSLLAALEALRDFSFRSSLFTYICSIANHKVIDFYRRRKIKAIVFSKIPDVEPLISTLFGPEKLLDEALLKQKIKQTFRNITPRYSKILKLKYVYGYTVSEIARKLSISFKSAESQLFRARQEFALAYLI
ncbi:RNA polymerase sigma factor [Candidatus Gottesmanbacteria bacterium]|nr:RNA polymerase sigma factor [Candidatus Gottesmanbacteria bacterium]